MLLVSLTPSRSRALDSIARNLISLGIERSCMTLGQTYVVWPWSDDKIFLQSHEPRLFQPAYNCSKHIRGGGGGGGLAKSGRKKAKAGREECREQEGSACKTPPSPYLPLHRFNYAAPVGKTRRSQSINR